MPVFVNNVEISDDEVHKELQHHPAPSVDEARHLAARSLVIRQLLLQEAERLELTTSDLSEEGITQAIETLMEQEISTPEADAETCKRYYDQHQESFIDKKSGKLLAFELVKEKIEDYLHTKALRAAISQYITKLAIESSIDGFEMQ